MNKKTIITAAIIIGLIFGFYLLQAPREVRGEMEVYMGENCQCCEVYANIMSRSYEVEKKVLSNVEFGELKNEWGIPRELSSCHTTIIDDYLVEGHIPMEAIEELRKTGKEIEGIGMAGMPAGSPGMGGFKNEPFEIYEISEPNLKGNLFLEL